MALPSSGQLSLGDINEELGRSRTAEISLDSAENGVYATINIDSPDRPNSSNPASISEWYNYNHTASPPNGYIVNRYFCDTCIPTTPAFVSNATPLEIGKFYFLTSGLVGEIVSESTGFVDDGIAVFIAYSNCVGTPCI